MNKTYIAIDLKSFYASVECVERKMDPLTTNLVVADASRTEKTICLAVSPSLKKWGIPGRARLFEVIQKVKEVNRQRLVALKGAGFRGKSTSDPELQEDPTLQLDFVIATPQMAHYIKISSDIYQIYLKYVAPEDIHVYSIDEVFMDVSSYLKTYRLSPRELTMKIIQEVLAATGITATAGIASNLYLCKIAMDIVAKHIPADKDGVRIAELDEATYRRTLWTHRPLTDFWRVGRGYARKLEQAGLFTMGDVARCSIGSPDEYYNEELLYRMFGINAELLIDHAWGWEPTTIADIKAYKPDNSSVGSGQVLHCAYTAADGRVVVREMADMLSLDLLDKKLVTDQIVLQVGYDNSTLSDPELRRQYKGPVTRDFYGRETPKPAHGSINLAGFTSSGRLITEAVVELYDRIVDGNLLIRRLNLAANHVMDEGAALEKEADSGFEQLDLFTDYEALEKQKQEEKAALEKERRLREAELAIQKKFGRNAILKGTSLQKGATGMDRNRQIGGHKA